MLTFMSREEMLSIKSVTLIKFREMNEEDAISFYERARLRRCDGFMDAIQRRSFNRKLEEILKEKFGYEPELLS